MIQGTRIINTHKKTTTGGGKLFSKNYTNYAYFSHCLYFLTFASLINW